MKLLIRSTFVIGITIMFSVSAQTQATNHTFTPITCIKQGATWVSQLPEKTKNSYCQKAAQKIFMPTKLTRFTLYPVTQKQRNATTTLQSTGGWCNNDADCSNEKCSGNNPWSACIGNTCVCVMYEK